MRAKVPFSTHFWVFGRVYEGCMRAKVPNPTHFCLFGSVHGLTCPRNYTPLMFLVPCPRNKRANNCRIKALQVLSFWMTHVTAEPKAGQLSGQLSSSRCNLGTILNHPDLQHPCQALFQPRRAMAMRLSFAAQPCSSISSASITTPLDIVGDDSNDGGKLLYAYLPDSDANTFSSSNVLMSSVKVPGSSDGLPQ